MPTTARVARIHEYGPPEVLRFEDIVVGEPGDDEALIRNTVIGLNFVDVYYRRGSLPVPAFPAIIGDEAAGVVEAVGKNVKNVSVGDRVVYGDIAFGAYATARLHPADRLVRIPAGVSDSIGVHVIPRRRRTRSTVASTIVGNDAKAFLEEEQQLDIPLVYPQ